MSRGHGAEHDNNRKRDAPKLGQARRFFVALSSIVNFGFFVRMVAIRNYVVHTDDKLTTVM